MVTAETKTSLRDRSARFTRPAYDVKPDADDLALMRLVAIAQYLAGGITLIAAAAIYRNDPIDGTSGNHLYLALGGVALVMAVIRIVTRAQMTINLARASNVIGILFIAVIVAVSRPVAATATFFLWPLITAAYFLPRRELVAVFGLFVVSFAVALWGFSDFRSPTLMFIPTLLVSFVLTVSMRLMRESLALQTANLERSASTDELTGLANRAVARDALHREIERSRRSGSPVSVALLDIDHFKAVNDLHGHAAGDTALRRVAALLADECRGADLPARYGGEEFIVVMPDTGLEAAQALADRLRKRVELGTLGYPAPLTVSAGVSTLVGSDTGIDDVLAAADAALYEAKDAGRNRVCVAGRHRSGEEFDAPLSLG